jgi:hypothetical protein
VIYIIDAGAGGDPDIVRRDWRGIQTGIAKSLANHGQEKPGAPAAPAGRYRASIPGDVANLGGEFG